MATKPKAYSYVRWSSGIQVGAGKTEEVIKRAQEFCDRKELDFQAAATFKDLGVSSFKGKNVDEGALGVFINAVEDGTIPRGSWLLIERLDRLSREGVMKALPLFLSLLNAGVVIATLEESNEQIWDAKTVEVEWPMLVIAMSHLTLAADASRQKSKLTRLARDRRNELLLAGAPLSAFKAAKVSKYPRQLPGWVRPVENGDGEIVDVAAIPQHRDTIRKIFHWYAAGITPGNIAKRLNDAEIKPWSSEGFGKRGAIIHTDDGSIKRGPDGKKERRQVKGRWYRSLVIKALTNDAVRGHKHIKVRERIEDEDGELQVQEVDKVITDYWPKIIGDDLWNKAQERRASGPRFGRPPTQRAVNPLGNGLMVCNHCGHPVKRLSKGAGNRAYFACTNELAGGCDAPRWRWDEGMTNLRPALRDLLTDVPQSPDVDALQGERDVAAEALERAMKEVYETREAAKGAESRRFFLEELDRLGVEVDKLETQVRDLNQQIEDRTDAIIRGRVEHLRAIMEASQPLSNVEGYAEALRALFSHLIIDADGDLCAHYRHAPQGQYTCAAFIHRIPDHPGGYVVEDEKTEV